MTNRALDSTIVNSSLVFIAGSTYGFIVPVIKSASDVGIYPATFLPLQYLFALIVCAAIMLFRKVPLGRPREFLPLCVLGLFTGGTSICYYTAVTLLPSAVALTLLFQYVWINVLIESIHKRKLPSASSIVAIAIIFIGTILATGLVDGTIGDLNPIGVAFGLGSALFYALYLYFAGVIGVGKPTLLRSAMLALGGVAITSIVNPAAYVNSLPDPACWPYSITLSFLGILIPTTIINFSSPKLSAGMVSIMASSELPVGVLAAWAFVGDVPTPLGLLGCMLVLVGIVCKQVPTLARRARDRH